MSKRKRNTKNNVNNGNNVQSNDMRERNEEKQDSQLEYGWNALERTDSWINSCDSKISILMGIFGVIITVFITSDSITTFYDFVSERVNSIINQRDLASIIWLIALAVAVGLCGKCIYHIISASFARINEKKYKQEKLKTNSSLFFGAVSPKMFKEYYNEFVNEDEDERLRDVISQVYINSCIANKKHIEYNKSLKWFIGTFLYIVIMIAISILCF